MTVLFIVDKLLNGYKKDSTITKLLDNISFHIIPMINPDGFVYTHTTDRMWRKTRSAVQGSTCVGI
jgi:murein tripeptide amidase MpaA